MSDLPTTVLRIPDLPTKRPTVFDVTPDAALRQVMAAEMGLLALKKCRLTGEITADGRHDWVLKAKLGATVVQPCVITLDPVTTRIDETVTRHYLAEMPDFGAGEVEMPDDDTIEPLPVELDLQELLKEALALALPLYPRAEGASLGQMSVTEPGMTPITDDEAKPFAALGALKQKLENKEE